MIEDHNPTEDQDREPTTDDWDFPANEKVGRMLDTPFGKELVVMKRVMWAYYDWLEDKNGDTRVFTDVCYDRHPDMKLENALSWLLNHIAYHRQEHGMSNPRWLVAAPLPSGFEEF